MTTTLHPLCVSFVIEEPVSNDDILKIVRLMATRAIDVLVNLGETSVRLPDYDIDEIRPFNTERVIQGGRLVARLITIRLLASGGEQSNRVVDVAQEFFGSDQFCSDLCEEIENTINQET